MMSYRACWLPTAAPAPPVDLSGFKQWEQSHGLSLPTTLRSVLGVHNGGRVERLGTVYDILPLQQICPLGDGSVRQLLRVEPSVAMKTLVDCGVPSPWLVFPFLTDQLGRVHLLCYPEQTPKAEPVVYVWNQGVMHRHPALVDDLLEKLVQASDYPAVDLQEAASGRVLADETLTMPVQATRGAVCEIRQILCEGDRQWTLYARELTTCGGKLLRERRTRAVIPLPLDSRHCRVLQSREAAPGFEGAWALVIASACHEQLVFTLSQLTSAGKWQSEELHGESVTIAIESNDLERMNALKAALIPPVVYNLTRPEQNLPPVKPQPQPAVQREVRLPAPAPTPVPIPAPAMQQVPAAAPGYSTFQPNMQAITESLRTITEGSICEARRRMVAS